MNQKILVTAASVNVGSELVGHLAGANQQMRSLTRNQGVSALPTGAEVVTGDLDRTESLTAAVKDVRGVFLLGGYQDMQCWRRYSTEICTSSENQTPKPGEN